MSLVRLLGFTTLNCGCVVGRYRTIGTGREVRYVEEKAPSCQSQSHRQNQTLATEQPVTARPAAVALHAS